ncbi:TldD/PmbA family protein [Nitrospira lenta]|uniref:Putative Peptidase U62, TldE-like n=1 Tax=Nitrospira lenta TaxID=1436998 RepID=A0A330LC41_9BACT|nr:TldD/PmbA family protein [Nitrospira lenta]SPP64579.1 putative Peptidase U62, TldE-like [Nitrospira lenta]
MTVTGAKPWPKMTTREEFQFIAEQVLNCSTADHALVALHDQDSGTTRFANNQVTQNVNTRRGGVTVTVAFGARQGTATTTDFTAGSLRGTVKRAETIARVSPEDPEYLPPAGPQAYNSCPTVRSETVKAGPSVRLEYANEAIGQCRMENMSAAGIVSSARASVGVAADTGLLAFEERTEARFSITVQAGDATGWASAAHRSIDRLKVQERTLSAIHKATVGAEPQELPPGRYRVILEPAAVAGLWSWIIWMLDAKSYLKGTSPFAGRLKKRILDKRLSLENCPGHADLLGVGFTAEGLPSTASAWIHQGVLQQLAYDRFAAQAQQIMPIPTIEAPRLSIEGSSASSLAQLIKSTDRAILVTNFWYLRTVNPTDLTLTGMTRDGTFLVEKGEIVSAVKNFRFHESPLRAFQQVESWTAPMEAVTSETGKMLVPAVVLPEFHFSSVTRF